MKYYKRRAREPIGEILAIAFLNWIALVSFFRDVPLAFVTSFGGERFHPS